MTPRRKRRPTIPTLPAISANLNDNQVLTIPEWCALNRFSKRTGQRILGAPGGPVVTQLSTKKDSHRRSQEWQKKFANLSIR